MHKYTKIYLRILAVSFSLAFIIYLFFPEYKNLLNAEDELVENITAFTFLITFLLNIKLQNSINNNKKKIFRIISIISLFGFLDEVSFGERLFNFKAPFIAGVKIDGIHDFLDLAKVITHKFIITNIDYSGLFILLAITFTFLLLKFILKFKNKFILFAKKNQVLLVSFLFIFFIAISQLIDVAPSRFIKPYWMKIIESIFEMYAAMALFTINLIMKKKIDSN